MKASELDAIKEAAREEGRREAEEKRNKAELRGLLVRHFSWFVVGCGIGGWVAVESGSNAIVVFWCAVGTGFLFSFAKLIVWCFLFSIIGC